MRTCLYCAGMLASKKRADAVYCSKKCKNDHWRFRFPEHAKAARDDWYARFPERGIAATTRWQRNNEEKYRIKQKEYYDNNTEQIRNKNRRWRANNPGKVNAQIMKRHAAKKNATPAWLTDENLWAMEKIYTHAVDIATRTGVPHDVDHIVPLTNPLVCGLHVPWNLKILTATQNRTKGSTFQS